VSLVMSVTKNVAVLSFPAFPKGGTLIVLQPPWAGGEPALSAYAAEVTPPSGAPFVLKYQYWHRNDEDVIGLMSLREQPAAVPLGSKVKFVARQRGAG
jgi:hypothetical protein